MITDEDVDNFLRFYPEYRCLDVIGKFKEWRNSKLSSISSNETEDEETIICSAIWFNDGKEYVHQPKNIKTGFVVSGRRHHNCYATLSAISKALGLAGMGIKAFERINRDSQGFITNFDRYVDRKEGYKIALAANQIIAMKANEDLDNHFGKQEEPILISEQLFPDLYSEYLY